MTKPIRLAKPLAFACVSGGVIPLIALVVVEPLLWPLALGLVVTVSLLGAVIGLFYGQHIDKQYKIFTDAQTNLVLEKLQALTKDEKARLASHSRTLTKIAEDYQDRATTAATAAAKATENATIIASAIEEMDTAILEIGRQANESSAIVVTAAEKTRQADVAASNLTAQSDEILSIVELIRSVAGKTNLLALNATIEAARAGEHGRGFAVVATEVKQLAAQTAEATTRIESQINSVREASHNMKAQMGALETTIDKINNITGVIQKALQEETAATHEIARSAQAASLATDDVTKGLSHMLITTEQIREASRALTDEADALRCDKTQD
ncbi:MAG: hypothetical protein EOM37_06540 [Proteobacteria bacterium]|jgi:methyl-accepting chemotaxis protein|nr:methyl-accepting chemotaxis protein [Alphaproteobacteria bacterium]NCC03687.1 hypothetical protein [Pseudomonadota bacterium]